MIIDTHAHLDMEQYADDRESVIRAARENGVEYILNIGCDVDSSRRSIELSEQYDFIYAAAGVHPHDVKTMDAAAYAELRELHAHPKVVAFGEIGLDYFRDHSPHDLQRLHFKQQLELARELGKPVIIHNRDAKDDMLSILSEYYPLKDKPSGIFHCFSGDQELAEQALAMGFYISFAGPVTFKNANGLRDVAKIIPPDRLFVETDSPYLSPMPHRGKRNEPANVNHTARKLAEIRGVTIEDVERTTALNFFELFGIGRAAQPGTISYRIRNSLYLNLTQRCTNACVFCTRLTRPVVQGYNLKLKREPSAQEVWESIDDATKYDEIVFCGYGEPTLRLDVIKEVAKKIKSAGGKVRLNTNGHGNVINKRNILPELAGLVDAVSVSLNADNSEAYDKICVPWPSLRNGIYDEIKAFIEEAKKHIPEVQATIVTHQDGVDESRCEDIAGRELGIDYRVRRFNMVG
ncbi:MAG: YchF/TatD family DNA exonuclease [Nitrospinales bacterium]